MLAFLLAILVGIAGLALMSTAFFFPGLYRKNDIIWGGVALFYALVLWICAQRITGAVLLGQTASVALTGWLGWQALMWRWSKLPTSERSTIADGSSVKQGLEKIKGTDWKSKLQSGSQKVKQQVSNSLEKGTAVAKETVKESGEAVKDAATEVAETATATVETATVEIATVETAPESEVAPPTESSSEATSESPAESSSSEEPATESAPKADSAAAKGKAGLGAVTGMLGGLRDRLQGRKSHGKKYVRPADKADAASPETTNYEADWEEATEASSEEASPANARDVDKAAPTETEAKEEAAVAADKDAAARAEVEAEAKAKQEAEAKAKEEAAAKAEAEAKAKEEAAAQAKAEAEAKAKAEEPAETEAEAQAAPAAPASTEATGEPEADADDSDTPEQSPDSGDDSVPPEESNWPPVDESENDSWVDGPDE